MDHIDIAAIFSTSDVYLYNAIGITSIISKTPEEAKSMINELAEKECKIIYLEEDLYIKMSDVVEKYKTRAYPIIIAVPSIKGSQGIGEKKIRENVEKAIGMDIL